MDERNNLPNEPWEQDSYETGRTNPPKSRRGLLALLLIAVIFLGGIASALGIMNIRLLNYIRAGNQGSNISFYEATEQASTQLQPSGTILAGLSGRTVSKSEQRWFKMPAGFLITAVEPGCCADLCGLSRGDVIYAVNGKVVSELSTIEQIVLNSDSCVNVEFYRAGQKHSVALTKQP